MAARQRVIGQEAVEAKGWFRAHQWLLLRRASQVLVIALFMLSPWLADQYGFWLIKGNLASSDLLETVPLSDPFVLSQTLFSGHAPMQSALFGALIVIVFYMLVGGRTFCSWVCPVNMVTDAACWLRDRLGIKGGIPLSRQLRFWILGLVFAVSAITGVLAWELVNPVSMMFRGLVFGMGAAWGMVLAVFLLDLLVSRRAWCGSLCPMGAFYSLIGRVSLVRVNARQRQQCDDCMDCFITCPEAQVIREPLKGEKSHISPVIVDSQCTNCGRCIDVCAENVFSFSTRFSSK